MGAEGSREKRLYPDPLHLFTAMGQIGMVRDLLDAGADIERANENGATARLIARGANVNASNKAGYAPLLAAAGVTTVLGDGTMTKTVQMLLAAGADPMVHMLLKDGGILLPHEKSAQAGLMQEHDLLMAACAARLHSIAQHACPLQDKVAPPPRIMPRRRPKAGGL